MKEIRPQLVAQNPDKHATDVVRMIGKSWETVDETKKQKLEAEYKKEKEMFEKELVKYESHLTPQMKEDLKVARTDRIEKRARFLIKKRNKDLGKPKRAATAFFHFIAAERKTNPKADKESVPTYVKKCGAKWATLSEAEKKPFVDAATKGIAQYKIEMQQWEARMLKEGNFDVVRNPIFTEQLTAPKKAAAATTTTPKPSRASRKSSEWGFGYPHSEQREVKKISSVNDSSSISSPPPLINEEFTRKSPPALSKSAKSANTADGDTSHSLISDKETIICHSSRESGSPDASFFDSAPPSLVDNVKKKEKSEVKAESSEEDKSKKGIFTTIKNIFKFWISFILIIVYV